MSKHVALIGMMGAGKSSVAPILAQKLGRPVVEVDALIEKQEGMPIGEIFLAKGEAYFRRIECEYITRLIGQPPAVLSLGGGAFMWEATRNVLLAETAVVYLTATLEILHSRLQATDSRLRPLLNSPGIDMQVTIKEMLTRRGAYYEKAHYQVATDFHSPAQVAESIVALRAAYD